jgi:hypothetical protein
MYMHGALCWHIVLAYCAGICAAAQYTSIPNAKIKCQLRCNHAWVCTAACGITLHLHVLPEPSISSILLQMFDKPAALPCCCCCCCCCCFRYPSYVEANGWRFPGVGEFQCYDRRALASLAAAAAAAGRPEWGYAGPHDSGGYNSSPGDTGFFAPGGSWDTGGKVLLFDTCRGPL